jgi:hypothetical protein
VTSVRRDIVDSPTGERYEIAYYPAARMPGGGGPYPFALLEAGVDLALLGWRRSKYRGRWFVTVSPFPTVGLPRKVKRLVADEVAAETAAAEIATDIQRGKWTRKKQ